MEEKKNGLIPTSILTLVLDQMKETSDEQAASSTALAKVINEITGAFTYPPTRKDLADAMEKAYKMIDENNRIMLDLRKDIEGENGIKTCITEMTETQRNLKSMIKIWLTVISIIISISIGGYALFQRTVDTQVQGYINNAVEAIVKSRPGNEWPEKGTVQDEKLPPHVHGTKGEIILLPEKGTFPGINQSVPRK